MVMSADRGGIFDVLLGLVRRGLGGNAAGGRQYVSWIHGEDFAHGAEHSLPGGLLLVDSYHCSRYNTNTRRLTPEMFRTVVGRAASLAGLQGARRRVGRS